MHAAVYGQYLERKADWQKNRQNEDVASKVLIDGCRYPIGFRHSNESLLF